MENNRDLLLFSLEMAVPLWVDRWKDRPWEERQKRATECGDIIASQADQILFKTKKSKDNVGTAAAFNTLAESLAILSFVPGGVKFLGRHWESA